MAVLKLKDFPRVVLVNDSTSVASLAYHPGELALVITYKTGDRYLYVLVPQDIFGKVVSADSVGKAVNEFIKIRKGRKLNA